MPLIDDAYLEDLKSKIEETSSSSNDESSFEEESDALFKRVLKLASAKEQCTALLKNRFSREGYDDDVVESALVRATECGLIDDARYAEVLVRSRLGAGKGIQGIERELRSLNIDISLSEITGDAAPDESDEVERAVALLNRKPPTSKNKKDTAYRRLVSKGYSSSVASSASRIWYESLTL